MIIWINDVVGFITGYSLVEQPGMRPIEVTEEPINIFDWRYDGDTLIYDENNPSKPGNGLSELEQLHVENEKLKRRQDETDEAILELADLLLNESLKGGE